MRPSILLPAVLVLMLAASPAHGDDEGPKIFLSGPGTLNIGPQGCLAYYPDAGGIFFLGNLGGFTAGDRVFVSGQVDQQALLCFPSPFPGIPDNTIQAYFEGCGVVGVGPQGCLSFDPDDSKSGFFLTDSGGYGPGAQIFIAGAVDPESTACFPVIGPAIEVDAVEPCLAGDVDADGAVDVDDLIAVIQQWGACPAPPFPCHADLDGDGQVTVDDLIAVIQNWS